MMTLIEAIRSRHSVRRYLHQPLSRELIDTLQAEIDECNRLGNLHIQLVTNETRAFTGAFAYGQFSGVENYFVMAGPKEPGLDDRIGYYGEKLVLLSRQLGPGTCWAGLSYRKVPGTYDLGKGEKIACMIALGYGATEGHPHRGKSIQEVSNASEETPEWFARGVEAALLAPTAVNQQKFYFRFLGKADDEKGLVRPERRFSLIGYTEMDLGIAKCHFEIGAGTENVRWI